MARALCDPQPKLSPATKIEACFMDPNLIQNHFLYYLACHIEVHEKDFFQDQTFIVFKNCLGIIISVSTLMLVKEQRYR